MGSDVAYGRRSKHQSLWQGTSDAMSASSCWPLIAHDGLQARMLSSDSKVSRIVDRVQELSSGVFSASFESASATATSRPLAIP